MNMLTLQNETFPKKPAIKRIETGERYLTQEQFLTVINENSNGFSLPPQNVVRGICSYLIQKNLISIGDITAEVRQVISFLETLNQMTKGNDFYKANALKYIYEGNNLEEVLQQILDNTNFWIDRFGVDFFTRYSPRSKERKSLMIADIDDDFYLSMKPGNGVGTFALDFAIGLKGRDFAQNVPSKEIWRTGIDTQKTGSQTSMRIIRTGGALKKANGNYEQKSEMYATFKKRYGVSPQRALAFLSMYIGKDLGVDEVKAITLEGARQKRLSLVGSSRINFDYTQLFKSVGFDETQNPNWLSIGNPDNGFYPALETSPTESNGLRAYETTGMDNILNAFRELRDVFNSEQKNPLTVCANQTRNEIEQAMNTFRTIHNK